jgi:hypothetical protein
MWTGWCRLSQPAAVKKWYAYSKLPLIPVVRQLSIWSSEESGEGKLYRAIGRNLPVGAKGDSAYHRFAVKSPHGLATILDEMWTDRGPTLALLFDSIVELDGKQRDVLRSIDTRLTGLSTEILKTADPTDLQLWLSNLRLRKWLDLPLEAIGDKLRALDMRGWSRSDLALAVDIFRLEADQDGLVQCLCAAFGG